MKAKRKLIPIKCCATKHKNETHTIHLYNFTRDSHLAKTRITIGRWKIKDEKYVDIQIF